MEARSLSGRHPVAQPRQPQENHFCGPVLMTSVRPEPSPSPDVAQPRPKTIPATHEPEYLRMLHPKARNSRSIAP